MNFLALFPLIMKAVNLAQSINSSRQSGDSVIKIIQSQGADVLDIVTQVGAQLFPNLPAAEQAQAGVVRFDPTLTTRIQTRLNELGAKLDVDGHYGNLTKAAVKDFQSKNGLSADGWAGPLTQAKLFQGQ